MDVETKSSLSLSSLSSTSSLGRLLGSPTLFLLAECFFGFNGRRECVRVRVIKVRVRVRVFVVRAQVQKTELELELELELE